MQDKSPTDLEITLPYNLDLKLGNQVSRVIIPDHLGGFDANLRCHLLERLDAQAVTGLKVCTEYFLPDQVKQRYPNLDLGYDNNLWMKFNHVLKFEEYNQHPELEYKNFVCSFNGTPHVGRKMLTAILNRFGWFDPEYATKNFVYDNDIIYGHIVDFVQDRAPVFYKFFVDSDNTFAPNRFSKLYDRFNHVNNMRCLELALTQSFVHVVSETMATSHCPWVTEKFLYSIVTRGLFVTYAQPGWHGYIEKYYGFKPYNRLFDYSFDLIYNPVERLIALMCMLSRFSRLSQQDWHDLYLIEQDTIEFNYDHYFSRDYLKIIAKHS